MRLIISENQLANIINILLEDNNYYDYNNVNDNQKKAFYKNKAGYSSNEPSLEPKTKMVMIYKWKGGDINNYLNWEEYKRFQNWALAQSWINKNVYPQNKKFYKIKPI